ncbi:hypothetical protein DFP72DRAFT_934157, partial [Ephemerocybe angulata]
MQTGRPTSALEGRHLGTPSDSQNRGIQDAGPSKQSPQTTKATAVPIASASHVRRMTNATRLSNTPTTQNAGQSTMTSTTTLTDPHHCLDTQDPRRAPAESTTNSGTFRSACYVPRRSGSGSRHTTPAQRSLLRPSSTFKIGRINTTCTRPNGSND